MMENLRTIGWNANAQDYDGRTAIAIAASQGNLEAVKYLISYGADSTIMDMHGYDDLTSA